MPVAGMLLVPGSGDQKPKTKNRWNLDLNGILYQSLIIAGYMWTYKFYF